MLLSQDFLLLVTYLVTEGTLQIYVIEMKVLAKPQFSIIKTTAPCAVFLSNFIGYKHCTHADLILKNTPKVITLWLATPASIVIPATKSYCGSIRSHEH